jgi:uncharacterized protein (DUF433 family)
LNHPLVSSAQEAVANIRQFSLEFDIEPRLQERVTLAHDWYAVRNPTGDWIFGHSKYVGHQDNNAARYLRTAKQANGGATESRLRHWFEPVPLDTPLGRELADALRSFLARRNRLPRKSITISVLSSERDRHPDAGPPFQNENEEFFTRITSDPRVCGGRPCIKGTRMRVSDLVEMMAHGATPAEIVVDFPYITERDIAASLAFAARAVDHRLIRAA